MSLNESQGCGASSPIGGEVLDECGGLIFAATLPGRESDFDHPEDPEEAWVRLAGLGRPLWIHLNRTQPRAAEWVRRGSGIPASVTEALLEEETRPRATEKGDGLVVILRGASVIPGAEPDELISIRIWLERDRIITLRQFHFETIAMLRAIGRRGGLPQSPVGLFVAIARDLADRMWPVVDNLGGLLDDAEAEMLDSPGPRLDGQIAEIRRQAIRLHRFLLPQREALISASRAPLAWIDAEARSMLIETAERTMRIVEDLGEIRDRSAVAMEELRAKRDDRLHRTTYLLTLVAAIFLPLSLVTGLLGVNVGGVPGSHDPGAFWIVSGMLVILAGLLILVFKRVGWL